MCICIHLNVGTTLQRKEGETKAQYKQINYGTCLAFSPLENYRYC